MDDIDKLKHEIEVLNKLIADLGEIEKKTFHIAYGIGFNTSAESYDGDKAYKRYKELRINQLLEKANA